jgi:hypothetical protein
VCWADSALTRTAPSSDSSTPGRRSYPDPPPRIWPATR